MKKQAVCEYCDQIFEEHIDINDYRDYKKECVEHEVTHLNLEEKFTNNLKNALNELDRKYNSISTISKIDVSACWDTYYGRDVIYDFELHNTTLDKIISSKIKVSYGDKEKIPTSEEIINKLEQHFFIPMVNQKYEGIFTFEGYCGGNGADDYMIGESYMRTIYKAFKDKKVRIEVME